MGHRLAAVPAVVDHQPVAVCGDAFPGGDGGGRQEQVAQQALVTFIRQSHPRDGLARDDEDVERRLGRNVPEGDAPVVLMEDRCRDFLVTDFFLKQIILLDF